MFEFDAPQLKALQRDVRSVINIPDNVLKEMVDVQAEVVEKALVFYAADMLHHGGKDGKNYSTGDLALSVKRQKPKKSKSGPVSYVKFEGYQHGNRNAEVAFVNEYGKKSQKARPFIATSIKEARIPGLQKSSKVLDEFFKSKNL